MMGDAQYDQQGWSMGTGPMASMCRVATGCIKDMGGSGTRTTPKQCRMESDRLGLGSAIPRVNLK
jgi:hypothetical protein